MASILRTTPQRDTAPVTSSGDTPDVKDAAVTSATAGDSIATRRQRPRGYARGGLVATSIVLTLPLMLAALSHVADIVSGRHGLSNLHVVAQVLAPVAPLVALNGVAAWLIARRRLDAIGKARGAILLTGTTVALCADAVLAGWIDTHVPPVGAITTTAFWVIGFVVPVLALRALVLGGGAWGGLRRAGGRLGDWLAATVAVVVSGGCWVFGSSARSTSRCSSALMAAADSSADEGPQHG